MTERILEGKPGGLRPVIYSRVASRAHAARRIATLPVVGGQEDLSPPAFSPSGGLVAFLAGAPGNRKGVLFVLDLSTGKGHTLAQVQGTTFTEPSWAPNGQRIAYTSRDNKTGRYGVYTIGLRDARPRRVARDGANPKWSPDGSRIAFEQKAASCDPGLCNGPNPAAGIYTIAAGGGGRQLVAAGSLDIGIDAWLANGRIAYHNAGHLYTLKPDGSEAVSVSVPGYSGEHRWSPDGTRLAYNSESTVWVAPAGGGPARALTHGRLVRETGIGELTWSPDGRWLAFTSEAHGHPGLRDVNVVSAIQGHRRSLVRARDFVKGGHQTGLVDIGWQP